MFARKIWVCVIDMILAINHRHWRIIKKKKVKMKIRSFCFMESQIKAMR